MHDGGSAIEGELPEHGLRLRLEAVDMSGVRIVQLEAERGQRGIAHCDLEILVQIVEGVDLRTQMSSEAGRLPAELEIRHLLLIERLGRTETDRYIETAGTKSGGDERVEEVVRIDVPVE